MNNVKHCLTDPSYSVVAQHVEDVAEQNKRARCQSVQVLCVRHLQGFPQKTPAAPQSTHVLTTRQSNYRYKYFMTLHTWPRCSVLGKRTVVLWCKTRQHGGNESWIYNKNTSSLKRLGKFIRVHFVVNVGFNNNTNWYRLPDWEVVVWVYSLQ